MAAERLPVQYQLARWGQSGPGTDDRAGRRGEAAFAWWRPACESLGQVEGQRLTRSQRLGAVGVPGLQVADVHVEALGNGIQGVALAHLVEGGLAARRGIAATQGQHLIDAQAAAGQVVPALEVGNAD